MYKLINESIHAKNIAEQINKHLFVTFPTFMIKWNWKWTKCSAELCQTAAPSALHPPGCPSCLASSCFSSSSAPRVTGCNTHSDACSASAVQLILLDPSPRTVALHHVTVSPIRFIMIWTAANGFRVSGFTGQRSNAARDDIIVRSASSKTRIGQQSQEFRIKRKKRR